MVFIILIAIGALILFGPNLWVSHVLKKYNRNPESNFPGTGGELARHLLDRFDLHGPDSLDATLSVVEASGLVVGFTSDWLYPPQGNREVVEALLRGGQDASYVELAMDFGHDSFLVRAPELYALIDSFLTR